MSDKKHYEAPGLETIRILQREDGALAAQADHIPSLETRRLLAQLLLPPDERTPGFVRIHDLRASFVTLQMDNDGTNQDPKRLTWAYYETVKAAAVRFGTIDEPSVVEHLKRLARDIKRRQGEDAD